MSIRYDENTKARAVRLVREHRDDYDSEWAAMKAISGRLGMNPETLEPPHTAPTKRPCARRPPMHGPATSPCRNPSMTTEAGVTPGFDSTLSFLTGDRWRIEPYQSPHHPLAEATAAAAQIATLGADAVCLFSGGLDSLCGVIDLLEDQPDRRLVLLSHNEGGQASTAQRRLYDALAQHYGADRIPRRTLFLPAPATPQQARPLPPLRENTTRSRSLLFLSAALAIAAAQDPTTPVYVPENGFIGINVPLTRARVGSSSTRTTHPHFLTLFANAASIIGHKPRAQPLPSPDKRRNAVTVPQPRAPAHARPGQRVLFASGDRPLRRPRTGQLRLLLPA